MKSILLTGATGLLGRYLLKDLLVSGQKVAVLTRSTTEAVPVRQRIDAALREFEASLGRTLPRPKVLEGSLQLPGLGLTAEERRWLAGHCGSVLHCAASVQFQREAGSDEPYRSNVNGTRHLLELSGELGLREFHYISTAYVCGDRQGTILEAEFNQSQSFRNDYEQSKYAAEALLRDASGLASLTIYRPSIIVGDAKTGYTSTFHGFYLPLQFAYGAARSGLIPADQLGYMQALGLHGTERKNLVPVDWVSAVIIELVRQSERHGQTYHLTNPVPATTGDIDAAIGLAIRQELGERREQPARARTSETLLDEFRSQMGVYAAYLSGDPLFDSRQTIQAVPDRPCPRLDVAALTRLAEFAIRVNFGWPRARPAPMFLDLEPLLAKLPHAAAAEGQDRLQLEVSGSGGGVWDISFPATGPCVVRGNGCGGVAVYMNVHTLRELLDSGRTISQVIATGRLVVEGPKERVHFAPALLEVLLNRLRRSE